MTDLTVICRYMVGCPALKGTNGLMSRYLSKPTPKTMRNVALALGGLEASLYCELIAYSCGRNDPFTQDIVRAYCFGGEEKIPLQEIRREDVRKFAEINRRRTSFSVETLLKFRILVGAKPHHSFVVLSSLKGLNGKRNPVVEGLLSDANNCLFLPAKVLAVKERLSVSIPEIAFSEKGAFEIRQTDKEIDKGFVGDRAASGDHVAVHWGMARDIISLGTVCEMDRLLREALAFFT